MALDKHILTRTEPTIELDEIAFKSYGEEDGKINASKGYGEMIPFISINGYVFSEDGLNSMNLNLNSTIPSVDITITDTNSFFAVDNYPRSGDVMSLRIASRQTDTFKDIRIDFDIESVMSPPRKPVDQGNGDVKYIIKGVMKIPGYFAERCKSYGVGDVLFHLESISTDLKLGFASNIDAGNAEDSMDLLVAYQTTSDVISNTVLHSYISDDSFQTFFIDPYYYLNFVDVNKMINSENTIDDTFANLEIPLNDYPGEEDKIESKLVLTNSERVAGTNISINKYALNYGSGKVARKNGYKRVVQFYENEPNSGNGTLGMISNDIEALSSVSIKDIEEPLKGRRGEERYLDEVKYKYVGRSSNLTNATNTHPNYLFAEIQNTQNMAELSKLSLEVELDSFNPGLYRFQKVPVIIYTDGFAANSMQEGAELVKNNQGFDNNDESGGESKSASGEQSINSFLTAHYIIGGIQIIYKSSTGKLTQKLTLLRREWPASVSTLQESSSTPKQIDTPEPEPVQEEPVQEEPIEEAVVTSSVSGFWAFESPVGGESSAQLLKVTGEKLNGESINVKVPGDMLIIYKGETATSFDLTPDDAGTVNADLEIFLKNPEEEGIVGVGDLEISGGGQLIKIIINVKVTSGNPVKSTFDGRFEHFYSKYGPKGSILTRRVSDKVVVITGGVSSASQLSLTNEAEWLLEDGLANGTII